MIHLSLQSCSASILYFMSNNILLEGGRRGMHLLATKSFVASIVDYSQSFLDKKPADIRIHSNDGAFFEVHKVSTKMDWPVCHFMAGILTHVWF